MSSPTIKAQIRRLAKTKLAEMDTAASKALMKWLARNVRGAKHIYVVGGAVRNYKIDQPVKDIDMVVDSLSLGKDAAWVAEHIARKIPAMTRVEGPDNLRVTKVHIKGQWIVDGHDLDGETLDIVDARREVYERDPETGEYVGHKPIEVVPTTLEEDVTRREFTFNTLMWRLSELAEGPDKAEIVDLTGCGIRDLENRDMRCPMDADEVFAIDPTRVIRIIKFAFKYGFKLPPDVEAAAKRQAKGLKRIPDKTFSVIRDIALESPHYKKALNVMADLGVTEVLAEMMEDNKSFRATMTNFAEKKGIAYLFDLMDKGIPVGASMKFLNGRQQQRLREITAPMDRDEALEFLSVLKNPGRAYDKKFIPSLAMSHGYKGKEMAKFMPGVIAIGREVLLEEPDLVSDSSSLMEQVKERVGKAESASRLAKTFTINKGQPVWYGKYKNQRGRVKDGWASKIYGDLGGGWKKRAGKGEAIPGGKARGKKPSDFDAGELDAGIEVEHEHLVGGGYTEAEARAKAQEIAMDHLAEIPDYYTRLDKMESEAGVKHASLIEAWGPTLREARGKAKKDKDKKASSLEGFLDGFFRRHPKLSKYRRLIRFREREQGSSSGHGEARQHGDEVWVFPKFWTHQQGVQDFVLAHEIGHWVKSNNAFGSAFMDAARSVGVDPWDTLNLPFGQFNADEAFADSFASYYTDGDVKRRYPEWTRLVEAVISGGRTATLSVDNKRPYPLLRQGSVYKPMSEITPGTQDVLDTPTPAWLDRDYPYVAPPDESCTIKELDYLTSLIPLRAKWGSFVKAADEDVVGLFVTLCSELGAPCDRQALDVMAGQAAVLVTKLKWLYNRPRPYQIAAKHNRLADQGRVTKPGDFWPMNTKTAHTPAYPSGHTIQAYLLASRLSEVSPQHRKAFMDLAHAISFSRAVGGYHWPSDLTFAKDVFRHIVMPHMPSSVRVAARYKSKKEVPTKDGDTKTVYEYSDAQVAHRHREKAKKVESLRKGIDKIRSQAKKDLKSDDPKTRLTALAVLLIDQTYERTGNEDTAEESGRFGVTSWRTKHVSINGNTATIKYNGKSDVSQEKKVTDPAVVSALKAATKGKKGEERVFCEGEDCTVKGKDVNEYLKPFDVTAKDIRGMHANEEMKRVLSEIRKKGPQLPNDRKEKDKILKEEFKKALEETAKIVGHEPSTLKSHYLVPKFEDSFMHDGSIIKELHKKSSAAASLAARWASSSLSDSEKENREDERLVRTSPKKKPPRRDLERGHVKDKDTSEEDPDKKQDKKDRSQNYKDAIRRVMGADKIPMVLKETGKTVMVTQETVDQNPGKYKEPDDSEDEGSESDDSPKEEVTVKSLKESLVSEFSGLSSKDSAERNKAISNLVGQLEKNLSEFVDSPASVDDQMRKELSTMVGGISQDELDVLVLEAQEAALGEEKLKDPEHQITEEEARQIEEEFTKGFVKEFKAEVKKVNDKATSRNEALSKKQKEYDDNRVVTDLKGEEADAMNRHLLETTRSSVAKYREIEEQTERDSALKEIESQIKEYPEGSKKRLELEAEKRGLIVSNILVDGPDAKGVGPSMSVMVQAAEELGRLDDFLELNLLGGKENNSAENQQQFRDVLADVGVEELHKFMPDDFPAKGAIEAISGPAIARMPPDLRSEVQEMIIDSIVTGIVFTDASLNESEPADAPVSKKNLSDINLSENPAYESILDRIRKMMERLKKLEIFKK